MKMLNNEKKLGRNLTISGYNELTLVVITSIRITN